MKKYISILTIAVAALFVGCSDSLERFPIDQLVEETAFVTVEDLQFGLNGAIIGYSPNALVAHNSIFTDNCVIGIDNGGQETAALAQLLNADVGDRGLWSARYNGINAFNRLFAAAAGITPAPAEVDQYNNILAQSHAFRALMHYELLLYYGVDMRVAETPGVPYVDYVSADATPARNTTGEVLAGIQADLDAALSLFPAGFDDISFATPDFVTFLKMRIALETGNNQAAIGFANTIISKYALANPTQYFNMFNEDADTTEVVWRYDSVQGAGLGLNFTWNFTGQGPFVEMSTGLLNEFLPTDIRRSVNIDPISNIDRPDVWIIGKYPVNADTNAINDFKAMRVSEAYLVRAEAYARTSQFGLAAADVFSVRSARDATASAPSYANLSLALVDVLAERRLELAFEGHRFTDIRRMRSVLNTGINRDPADCGGAAAPCTLAFNSEKWVFPVPTVEINANVNMTQAPGY